jgi:hypothetical protein
MTHADENAFVPPNLRTLLHQTELWRWSPYDLGWRLRHEGFAARTAREIADGVRALRPDSVAAYNLAGIRKAAATDAINAISLAKIVNALRERDVRIRCHIIPDGTPRRFVWSARARTFTPSERLRSDEPTINLLGPSERLVRKHWHRLPIGLYALFAVESVMRKKNITPSNQLSYIACFKAQQQRILVSGDGGCVDFQPRHGQLYYKELLGALRPLHVVQVAHHAGNNKDFYHVLQAAKYPTGVKQSFLLVSHATQDKVRPSRVFRQFIGIVRNDAHTIKILFTAQPRPENVRDVESLVHPPVGQAAEKGDVRLEFRDQSWMVTKHAITVHRPSQDADGTMEPLMALKTDMAVRGPVKLVKRGRQRSKTR